jgi:hypothetical protein
MSRNNPVRRRTMFDPILEDPDSVKAIRPGTATAMPHTWHEKKPCECLRLGVISDLIDTHFFFLAIFVVLGFRPA